jgi:hypothetical protein
MQYVSVARFISDARRLEIYPPFLLMNADPSRAADSRARDADIRVWLSSC